MMRGIIVIITALLAVGFLKRKQYIHHWTSLLSIIAGVAIVGIVSVAKSDPEDQDTTPTTMLGVVMLLVSQCFTGLLFITEEKFLSGYYLDPLYVVGLEGMWGLIYFVILLPIFQ